MRMTGLFSSVIDRRMVVPFLWLFCVTILIKIDGEEGFYPLFRTSIFAALPFALFHIWRAAQRARFTVLQWVQLLCVAYLILYPFATMAFVPLNVRNLKDAAYTLSIYAILLFLIRRYFTHDDGRLDVPSIGRFWVLFAYVQSSLAVLLWLGLAVDLGSRLDFSQKGWLDGRLHGLLGTSSHLSPVVGIACLFVLAQRASISRTAGFGLLFGTLVMTGSRSALIGFFGAAIVLGLVWVSHLRLPVKKVYQVVVSAAVLVGIALYFFDQATAILQMALRIDPAGWQKSRTVMWGLRLSEFYDRDLLTQLLGAGHRAIGQTFNANVDFLVNYGVVYVFIFNAFYLAMVLRSLARALVRPHLDNVFMLMIAVFIYLYLQGLNPVFSAFVSAVQLAMVLLVLRQFERLAAYSSVPAAATVISSPSLMIQAQPAR
jgi:hypothetical protein